MFALVALESMYWETEFSSLLMTLNVLAVTFLSNDIAGEDIIFFGLIRKRKIHYYIIK